jgi:nitric oxide synthase-interacting protein
LNIWCYSVKQLIAVKFETAVEDHDESEARFAKASSICPVCRKGFTNSTKLSILKSCGHVYCDSCCKQFVKKEGRCQICNKKTKEKDIVSMKSEGSGFSSGGAKEARKFDVAFQ